MKRKNIILSLRNSKPSPAFLMVLNDLQREQFFDQSKETMKLRAIFAEHLLKQFRSRYLELHCTTARERYDLLMQRCPSIIDHLDLQDIASFLRSTSSRSCY